MVIRNNTIKRPIAILKTDKRIALAMQGEKQAKVKICANAIVKIQTQS